MPGPNQNPPPTPKSENQPDKSNLKNYIRDNPNLTDLEKLKIALQIAEITRRTHESGNVNLDFSLSHFQVKRTDENEERIDIGVLPGFRSTMGKFDVLQEFKNTNADTTPPELRNPSADTALVRYVNPSSDIWRMGQAFKAIGLPEEVCNWISTDKSENRPDLNEKIIPALKNAIKFIQNPPKEAIPRTRSIDEKITAPPPKPLDLTDYTIKMMSEYDPNIIPGKNTIYFSENGDFMICEKDNPNVTKGNIELKTTQPQLKQLLAEENKATLTFKRNIKAMILEQLNPSEEVSIQEVLKEEQFDIDVDDKGRIAIPLEGHDLNKNVKEDTVPLPTENLQEDLHTKKTTFTKDEIKRSIETPLSEYTFKEVPKEKFKLEVGDIYLDISGNYAFLDPDNPKIIHKGNCEELLSLYLSGLPKDEKKERFSEIIEQPLQSDFRQDFQKMILDKIINPRAEEKERLVQVEMEIDNDDKPVSRKEHRANPVVFENPHASALPLIESPLMSDAMREYRNQIFASHLENLPHELHSLSDDLAKAKSYNDRNDPKLAELRMNLEMNSLYWERAIEIQNKNTNQPFGYDTTKLHQLVLLDKIVKDFNDLITRENTGTLNENLLTQRLDDIHRDIKSALGTPYFTRDFKDPQNKQKLKEIKSLIERDKKLLVDLKDNVTNNKPISASERHRSIRSLENVLQSIGNFITTGIGNLINNIRRAPKL